MSKRTVIIKQRVLRERAAQAAPAPAKKAAPAKNVAKKVVKKVAKKASSKEK